MLPNSYLLRMLFSSRRADQANAWSKGWFRMLLMIELRFNWEQEQACLRRSIIFLYLK